jgi:DNA repair photolyase
VKYINAKSIISGYSENNFWFGHNYNMNIYKGCSHGCIYCDSRSECYQIENFMEVKAKKNAIKIIQKELSSKRKKGVVGTGAMSDPYNPLEQEHQLTREALELIDRYGYGVSVATKSDLILRDMDIYKRISKHSPVLIMVTITTTNDKLAKSIEPNVSSSSERFEIVRSFSEEGIDSGILFMPILPFITDTFENINRMVLLGHRANAKFIYPSFGMSLRDRQRTYYYEKVEKIFPGIKEKYIAKYGNDYWCMSPKQYELEREFKYYCDKYEILYDMDEIIRYYKRDYQKRQMSIFNQFYSIQR